MARAAASELADTFLDGVREAAGRRPAASPSSWRAPRRRAARAGRAIRPRVVEALARAARPRARRERRARATSASSSAAACPPRSPRTGWPAPGTRTPACTSASPAAAAVEAGGGGAGCSSCFGLPAPDERRLRRPAARWRTSPACSRPRRHAVLARAGWDVEEDGLRGAPPVHVVIGAEAHVTVLVVAPDARPGQRRARAAWPRTARAGCGRGARGGRWPRCDGPTIVCAQAGNVNTAPSIRSESRRRHRARARGLAARGRRLRRSGPPPRPRARHLARGVERADSWATDGAQVAERALRLRPRHRARPRRPPAAMTGAPPTSSGRDGAERDPARTGRPSSRAARAASPVYAALRSLGRDGVARAGRALLRAWPRAWPSACARAADRAWRAS